MDNSKKKKKEQLGIDPGTAANRLRKAVLFSFAKRLDLNFCYQCGCEIENIDKFTMEHKTPWLDSENPKHLFFDIDNIAFSHASCNYRASRGRIGKPCPSLTAYRKGCRCEGCLEVKRRYKENKRKYKDSVKG